MSSGFLGSGIGPTAIKRRSGLAAPVPVAGVELIVNGTFSDSSAWVCETSWAIGGGVATKTPGAFGSIYQQVLALGVWYRASIEVTRSAASGLAPRFGTNYGPVMVAGVNMATGHPTGTSVRAGVTALLIGADADVDNISYVPLTLSSLMSTRLYASANCDLSAAVTRTDGTQAGFVARLDSATSPANFIIAYLDGAGNVKVDKCVAGTYTNVISGAITYGAGKVLRLVCNGNSVSAYYDGTQVGSTVTVSDAGIVSNTRHGLFSTYASNSFAGYVAA